MTARLPTEAAVPAISYAYKALNNTDPDCGTSFTWVARVFGRHTGWLTGWVIVAADLIVMANLAGTFNLDVSNVPDSARGGAVTMAGGSSQIVSFTDALRSGGSQFEVSSFGLGGMSDG